MSKTKNKTTETANSVFEFINTIPDETKQKDSLHLVEIFKEVTGYEPKLWGPNIIGFGNYHYKYASGYQGDAAYVGFSPRKPAFSLYLDCDFDKRDELLANFGKYKAAKACIYFKKVADINIDTLKKMIRLSVGFTQKKYPPIASAKSAPI